MNCFEFRRHSLSDPDTMDNEWLHHMKSCTGCTEFYSDIKNFDNKLFAAMKIDVPENLQSRLLLQQSFTPESKRSATTYYALAASLLVFITAVFMTVWQHDNHDLNELVIAYVEGVNVSNSGNSQIQYTDVDQILQPLGIRLDSEFGPIQAARPCYIRGKAAAHLVLPGAERSIDVLYMPSENIEQRIQIIAHDKKLILIPCPKGSLAIVGTSGEELATVERRLHLAANWL